MGPHRRSPDIRRARTERRHADRRDLEERRRLPEVPAVRKLLVTGDRNWDDIPRIVEALRGYRPGTVLVHGACQGADIICAAVAETLGFEVRPYSADWDRYKKAAGPIRNREMLTKEHRPEEPIDLVLAFHNDIDSSSGTADMLDQVIKASIPWLLVTSHPGPQQVTG